MADVFVSYARGDQDLARLVAERLSGAGFTAWWDSDLLPHNKFANVIEEEIGAASAVIVLWSRTAIASSWVRGEAELARAQNKLIQVVIDHSQIPLPFNQYQAADLSTWRGDPSDPHWRKVLASVADRVFTAFPNVIKKAQWVGNPLRAAFLKQGEPAARFAGRAGPLKLLVVGGSLGARALNAVVPKALALIAPAERPQVTHQSGAKQIDERLIRLASLGAEAWHDIAKVGFVERGFLVDLASEEPLAERAERHEPDAEFLERGQDFRFRFPPPQRVFALQGSDRLDGVRTADGLDARFGQSEVFHLAFPD